MKIDVKDLIRSVTVSGIVMTIGALAVKNHQLMKEREYTKEVAKEGHDYLKKMQNYILDVMYSRSRSEEDEGLSDKELLAKAMNNSYLAGGDLMFLADFDL